MYHDEENKETKLKGETFEITDKYNCNELRHENFSKVLFEPGTRVSGDDIIIGKTRLVLIDHDDANEKNIYLILYIFHFNWKKNN